MMPLSDKTTIMFFITISLYFCICDSFKKHETSKNSSKILSYAIHAVVPTS